MFVLEKLKVSKHFFFSFRILKHGAQEKEEA